MIVKIRSRTFSRACVVVVLVSTLFVCAAWRATILTGVGRGLDVSHPPQSSDYVLVLPGHAETRPYVAAALVKVGLAHNVILLKPKKPLGEQVGIPSHEVEKLVVVARGVPERQIIVLETQTDSTFGDAQSLSEFMNEHPDSTVNIVTNDFHTRRARFVFSKVLAEKKSRVGFISAPTDRFSQVDWWHHKAGLSNYFSEYLKLGYYYYIYGNGFMWTGLIASIVFAALILVRRPQTIQLLRRCLS